MPHITSFRASEVPPDTLRNILTDYVALDRARMFRRLLVTRFGILVLVAIGVAFAAPGLSMVARTIPIGLFLAPPAWAWIVELRLEHRLSDALEGVDSIRKS
jgi:hypothetical protein